MLNKGWLPTALVDQLTSWASITMQPTWRIRVDLPPMLGPVTSTTHASEDVSFTSVSTQCTSNPLRQQFITKFSRCDSLSLSLPLSLSLSLRFNGYFPGEPGLAGFKELRTMETTGAKRRAKLQPNRHHQQTKMQFFNGRMPFDRAQWSPNQQRQSTIFSRCDWPLSMSAPITTVSYKQHGSSHDSSLYQQRWNLAQGLFVCLGFNGTFRTNRLYRAIKVG